jgi:signal transduction histidine kinase
MFSTKWNKTFKGIRFRLTLVYSTLFGLFICIFAFIITREYFLSGRQDFDSSLINYAIGLSDHLTIDPSGVHIALKVPESEIKKSFPFVLGQTFYSVRDISGRILAKNVDPTKFSEIPFDPTLPLKQDYTHRILGFNIREDKYRAVNLKITNSSGKEMILQVATIYNSVVARENEHLIITFLMVPFFIIGSSFFSFVIAGNALHPIKALTETANNIVAQNLSLRVPEFNTEDEVEELSKTLNHLLERLEISFKAQEHFVANASHQLNTPLSIIKGELDVLESKDRSKEEISKFHQSLREELQRLIELVKNMLLISRVKSGLENFVFSKVRLDEVLLTTSSRLSSKAKEKKILVRFNIEVDLSTTDLMVMGEKQLLDAIFENIIDNAIKYSPEESTIFLDIKKVDGNTEVWIMDEGPGIREEELKHIMNGRFQRAIGHIPGSGIGLSLAKKMADFHQAQIKYKKLAPAGSLFMIEFKNHHTLPV